MDADGSPSHSDTTLDGAVDNASKSPRTWHRILPVYKHGGAFPPSYGTRVGTADRGVRLRLSETGERAYGYSRKAPCGHWSSSGGDWGRALECRP